jgi:hypothetical protein
MHLPATVLWLAVLLGVKLHKIRFKAIDEECAELRLLTFTAWLAVSYIKKIASSVVRIKNMPIFTGLFFTF